MKKIIKDKKYRQEKEANEMKQFLSDLPGENRRFYNRNTDKEVRKIFLDQEEKDYGDKK